MGVQDNSPPQDQQSHYCVVETPQVPNYQQEPQHISSPQFEPSHEQDQQQTGYQSLINNSPPLQTVQQASQLQQLNFKINNGLSCINYAGWFYLIVGSLLLGFNIYSGRDVLYVEKSSFFPEYEKILISTVFIVSILSDMLVKIAAMKMFGATKTKKASDVSVARCLLIFSWILIAANIIILRTFISIIGFIIIVIVIAQLSALEQDMLKRDNIIKGNQVKQV